MPLPLPLLLLLTSSAHMKQDIFTVPQEEYILSLVSTLLLPRPRPRRRCLTKTGFDFDSGALQVFVRLEWEPGKVDEEKRGRGRGNWTQQRQPSRSYCTSFLCISYKTTHAACGAVFGSLPHRGEAAIQVNLTRRGQHQSAVRWQSSRAAVRTQDPRPETGVSNRRRCRCSK